MRVRTLLAASIVVLGLSPQCQAVSAEGRFQRPEVVHPDRLREFVLTYRCGVVERLSQIHENKEAETDRFFILALKVDRPNYVQCIFLDGDTRMLCEAASGFYQSATPESRIDYLAADRIAALERLGFSTDDSGGNFQLMIEFDGDPDLVSVAETVLTALFVGYGARMGMGLEWTAPLADFDPWDSSCLPIG